MVAKIGLVLGSKSDKTVFADAQELLAALGIECELHILSAHRSPEQTIKFAKTAEQNKLELIIAGAGGAAHLPGIIAAHTSLPVIGVPIAASPLGGWDSLLSICQMPKGVPVATMAVGPAGAINAALFAAQILALKHPSLKKILAQLKATMERDVAFSVPEIIKGLTQLES
jgi:5-(carboxyamino)imidazole ribonucleotide mutase